MGCRDLNIGGQHLLSEVAELLEHEALIEGLTRHAALKLTPEGQKSAMDYFNKSIEFDPNYAPAYAGLMGVWAFSKQMDFVSTEEANPRMDLSRKAVKRGFLALVTGSSP